jgi:hypothetical protein
VNSTTVKTRCKAGDLAFFTSPKYQKNLGLVVKVLRLATEADCHNLEAGVTTWFIESQGRPIFGSLEGGEWALSKTWSVDDDRLTPIRGDEPPCGTTTKRKRKPALTE